MFDTATLSDGGLVIQASAAWWDQSRLEILVVALYYLLYLYSCFLLRPCSDLGHFSELVFTYIQFLNIAYNKQKRTDNIERKVVLIQLSAVIAIVDSYQNYERHL